MKPKLPKALIEIQNSSPSSSLTAEKANPKHEKLVQKVWDWITHVLPKPTEDYNNMPPCPYARVALSSGNVMFHVSDDLEAAVDIKSNASDYGQIHHVLIWTNPSAMTPKQMMKWMRDQNKNHFGIWIMGMHPHHPNAHFSVWETLDMDDFALILVQQLPELDMAFNALLKTPYYYGVEEIGDLVERRMCSNAWNDQRKKEIRKEETEEDEEEDEVMH